MNVVIRDRMTPRDAAPNPDNFLLIKGLMATNIRIEISSVTLKSNWLRVELKPTSPIFIE